MMAYSEDDSALAAEYALGTLDSEERAQVETRMVVDGDFTALVHAWEYRLGALNQMVGSIEPSPEVWGRITAEIAPSELETSALWPDDEIESADAPVVEPVLPGAVEGNVLRLS